MVLSCRLRNLSNERIYLLSGPSDCGVHLLFIVIGLNERIRLIVGLTAPPAANADQSQQEYMFHALSFRRAQLPAVARRRNARCISVLNEQRQRAEQPTGQPAGTC